jgi:hypothetical protein
VRPKLTDIRDAGDYQTTFRWNLRFPEIPAALRTYRFLTGLEFSTFNTLCQTSSIPSKMNQKIEIGIRGHFHHEPGIFRPASNSLQLTFMETVKAPVQRLIYAWQEICWEHNTGKGRRADDVAMKAVELDLLGPDDRPTQYYTINWVFLEASAPPSIGSDSTPFPVSVTLNYDDFEWKPGVS